MINERAELLARLRHGPVWSDGSPIGSVVGEINGATMLEAADLIAALTTDAPRDRAYEDGIRDAAIWLRDQQHKNPPDSLWHAAAILADRLDALLPTTPAPVSDGALREALAELEAANDHLCSLRTREQYRSLIDSGQSDALLRLDEARLAARNVLSTSAPVLEQGNQPLDCIGGIEMEELFGPSTPGEANSPDAAASMEMRDAAPKPYQHGVGDPAADGVRPA